MDYSLQNYFLDIQIHVDCFVTPPDVGRIPHKISSGFSFLTATLIYSLLVLKAVLPTDHYKCWLILVESCLLISSRTISQVNVSHLIFLLIQFCKTFENIYRSSACTPNLHLHCHLHECFGPANAFWLFACERLNGILGSLPTNHHSIEAQLMRQFMISQQALASLSGTDHGGSEIDGLLHPFYFHKGSLKHEELKELSPLERLSIDNVAVMQCALLHPIKEK